MNNSRTKKILILTATVFVVLLILNLVWLVFIKMETKKVLELKQAAETELQQNYSLIGTQKRVQGLRDRNNKLEKIFVARSEVVSFIERIEKLALTSGANLSIQAVDVKDFDDETFGSIDLIFAVTGQWSEVSTFLKKIENLPYYAAINSFKLETTLLSDADWSADFSVSVLTK